MTISDTEFKTLKHEVDSLQVSFEKENTPWHRNASVIIALTALVFSFGTTLISYFKSHQQDVREARRDLRGIVLKLIEIPKRNFELSRKYKNDPSGDALSQILGHENSILATQAWNIVDRFKDVFSPAEYNSIAHAMALAGEKKRALDMYEKALKNSTNIIDQLASLRGKGNLLITSGEKIKGRDNYSKALLILRKKSPRSYNKYFWIISTIDIELSWAEAEYAAENILEAKNHIGKAVNKLEKLPDGPMKYIFTKRVMYYKKFIESLPVKNW